ncbi:MAG TPA: SBBP repeat-containing protein, partial [Pyrinomonadaceae bacterium]
VAFELGDYDARHPLVIDPVISYSTYLGGTGFDEALAVARGSDGSLYVAGYVDSADFPGPSSVQAARRGLRDSFVLRLNPAGTALLYATYVGGTGEEQGTGVAVDAEGNAYVVGNTSSSNFPVTAGALQAAPGGGTDGFAFKLNPSGTALLYSTYLGGPSADFPNAVAVDAAGRAHVAGRTFSSRFINGAQMPKAGSPVYKTTDAAATWQPAENGIDDYTATAFAIHPTDPNTVYAGTTIGVYKTTDGGATWSPAGGGTAPRSVSALLIDRSNPSTVYAATFASTPSVGIHKSTDGGASFVRLTTRFAYALAADPAAPNTIYAGTSNGIFKTTDGGATWGPVNNGLPSSVLQGEIYDFAIDPSNTMIVYAATRRGVYKTTDGGGAWAAANNGFDFFGSVLQVNSLLIDPSAPSVLYAGTISGGVFKTTNGGASWSQINTGLQGPNQFGTFTSAVVALAINPSAPSVLYAGTLGGGIYKTADGGATWAASSAGLINRSVSRNALEVAPSNPATIYAGFESGADAFAVRLNAQGTAADYSVYLGSSESDEASGVALDAAGNAYLAGSTSAGDFPTAGPFQAAFGGGDLDGFVAKLSPAGATLYSTYLGGTGLELAFAIAVDSAGRAHVTGLTSSANFPLAGPRRTSNSNPDISDVYVARFSPAGSALEYSVLHGGQFSDWGHAIALDPAGNAYVTGSTNSIDFPMVSPSQNGYGLGGSDAFVFKLGPASEVIYSTYLGGGGADQGRGIAVDAAGTAYVVGQTSGNFPLVAPLDPSFGGGSSDGFVARLTDATAACTYSLSRNSVSVAPAASTGAVSVTAGAACAWTAASNVEWITITAGASGQGNGTVNYAVAPHSGATARSGTMTIAGLTFTVTQGPASPRLQFSQASYQFSEASARATLTVTRTGDPSDFAVVDYQTADADTFTVGCADAAGAAGNAFARCDFATAVGTLIFAPGETAKTITVPLIDDGHAEGPETFQVRLSDALVASLGTPAVASVTVEASDAGGAPNPVVASKEFFVRQQYLDFLSREPDDAGFDAWLGVLNGCVNIFTGPEVQSGCDRIHVSGEGFFRSVEFQLKGAYVFRFYRAAFGRLPEYTEMVSDMSFIAGATEQQVHERRAQLAQRFTQRGEFTQLYNGMTNAEYVAALLGRYQLQQVTTPDPVRPDTGAKVTLSGAELTSRLSGGLLARAQVLRAVADSDEVGAREFDNAFVAMQYYGYLRRKPEPAGFEAWLRVLQSGDTRTMVNGFLNSVEYKLRFGQP